MSAGVFGVPLGLAVMVLVSLLTPAPGREAGRTRPALPRADCARSRCA